MIKTSKCILSFRHSIIHNYLAGKSMCNVIFTPSPEHSDPHSTLVFPTADLLILDGQEFPGKVTCLYNWDIHGNKNGPKNIIKCQGQDFMLF